MPLLSETQAATEPPWVAEEQEASLAGRHMLVLGHGREGASAARFLAARGAQVTAVDQRFDSSRELEGITLAPEALSALDGVAEIVVSPGIGDNALVRGARERGIPMTNATRMFFRLCPCPIVGITGSSGKSTTSALIAAILREAGFKAEHGGNIGIPMLDLLQHLDPDGLAVLELSSFQLERLEVSPHVAVVTNITPNHLDRHGDMASYIAAKRNIVAHQRTSDFAVLNDSDVVVRTLADDTAAEIRWFGAEGAFVRGPEVRLSGPGGDGPVMDVAEIRLPGRHNLQNVLAAIAASAVLGVPLPTIRTAVAAFRGLPHRLEWCGEIDGIGFVDDSIATSPERAAAGVESMDRPVVLIAGGRSKNLSWTPLLEAASGRVKRLFLIGEASDEIEDAFRTNPTCDQTIHIERADSLASAVVSAAANAGRGDVVLLSPGCTSYDMFEDFEQRGRSFKEAVGELSWRS